MWHLGELDSDKPMRVEHKHTQVSFVFYAGSDRRIESLWNLQINWMELFPQCRLPLPEWSNWQPRLAITHMQPDKWTKHLPNTLTVSAHGGAMATLVHPEKKLGFFFFCWNQGPWKLKNFLLWLFFSLINWENKTLIFFLLPFRIDTRYY